MSSRLNVRDTCPPHLLFSTAFSSNFSFSFGTSLGFPSLILFLFLSLQTDRPSSLVSFPSFSRGFDLVDDGLIFIYSLTGSGFFHLSICRYRNISTTNFFLLHLWYIVNLEQRVIKKFFVNWDHGYLLKSTELDGWRQRAILRRSFGNDFDFSVCVFRLQSLISLYISSALEFCS